MNVFEIEFINIILIISPFLIYLFYTAYNENISKKTSELFLELAIFSSFYLLLKYGIKINGVMLFLNINIPLLIAFWYKRNISSIILSVILVFYYNNYLNYDLTSLFIEYIFYFVLYLFINKKEFLFINVFAIVKITMIILQAKYVGLLNKFNSQQLFDFFISVILFYLSAILIIYLIKRGDEIIKYHMDVKELKKQEQIANSLFKITHEIKNPIAVCKGYLDMFDVNNIEHSRKYIPIIRSEIKRTLILLQDFLTVSKIKIEKEIMDVNLLLEEATNNFKTIMKENNINLVFKNDLDLEIYINGDYNRLSQVVINIIKNSIEAIKDEGTISIDVKENHDNVEIIINDNGIGIDNIDKIKEPFFTTKKDGTGLGVPLSQEIIKAHNGIINYKSKIGEGTTVNIILPKRSY